MLLGRLNVRISRGDFLEQMLGNDYQVLDIDEAVAERRRADITQIKGLVDSKAASPLTILGDLFPLESGYYACAVI